MFININFPNSFKKIVTHAFLIVRSIHCLFDDLRSSRNSKLLLILVANSALFGVESDLGFRNLRLNIDFGLNSNIWRRIMALFYENASWRCISFVALVGL